MNGLPYYKAYPRDFIEGTVGMDLEMKGTYRLILDLIYMQGGKLPDDSRYIAGLLGCSVKKWNSLRERLVEAGKIEVRGAYLGNDRADEELKTLAKLSQKQSENRSRPNKNNNLQSPPSDHTEPDTESYGSRVESAGAKRSPAPEARDALPPTDRELILEAMGLGPDGIVGPGRMIGGQGDMAEVRRWLDLPGMTLPTILEEIRRIASSKPDGPALSFKYFTPAMTRLSGQLVAPPLTPQSPQDSHHDRFDRSRPAPSQRRQDRPDPALEQIARLAGLGCPSSDGRG
jgi:uncharacterized protein YdaU (DUF1376 family)